MTKDNYKYSNFCEVYIDESSQTAHRYIILGGIIISALDSEMITESLRLARLPELPAMEIGWVKVSKAKLEAYRRFVDVFFECSQQFELFHFHSIVIDSHKLNHTKFNQGSKEVGFNKEVFQLCSKFSRVYPTRLFHIYPDNRPTKSATEDLRLMLNRALARKGDKRDWPFRRIHFRESHSCQLLQLVDLFTGAIAYHINGHASKKDASIAKIDLSNYILAKAGIANPLVDTAVRGKFTIWHRKLK